MRRLAYLHPLFFLLGSILFLYSQSAVIASPDQMIRPLLALAAVLLLLAYPAYWLTRDWGWASVLLSAFVLGFCSTQSYFLAAGVISVAALLLWIVASRLRRRPVKLQQANGMLTLVSFLLAIIFAIPLLRMWNDIPRHPVRPADAIPIQASSVTSTPDIYYIVLDGYARADILQKLYSYDNTEFIRALRARGFIVPENNHSNYSKTALSVTSTLSMDYVDTFATGITDEPYWWLMSPYIDHSRVRVLLDEMGYTSVALASDWGITDNLTADVYVSPARLALNDYENILLFRTPLGVLRTLLAKVAYVQSYDSHRDLIRFQFTSLASLPNTSSPKFVFAHFVAPHPPFVFDAQGNFLQPTYPFSFNDASDFPFSADEYRTGYITFGAS